jgi:hypothetical protein
MIIDEQWIEKVYQDLTNMDIQLDHDPLEFGPDRLNLKTAEVRNLLSRVEKLFIDVSQNLHKYKRDLLVKNTEFTIARNRLMAEDPHVRAGRSQSERETLAGIRLTDMTVEMKHLEVAVQDLDEILKVIKAKRTDLKDIQGRLKDQLKLCQEGLGLGRRWGKSDNVVKVIEEFNDNYKPMVDDTTLDAVLNREEVKPTPAPKHTAQDIDTFFSTDIETTKKKIDDLDIDDLWNID